VTRKYLLILFILFGCSKKEISPPIEKRSYILKSGDNLELALKGLGIKNPLRFRLLRIAIEGGFPVKQCRVGDTISSYLQGDSLVKIVYRRGIKFTYLLDENGLAMGYHHIRYRDELITGKITSNLYESMLKIGESPELVVDFASIFAWQIDFFTETRTGDSFTVFLRREYVDSIPIGYQAIEYLHYGGEIGNFSAFRYQTSDGKIGYYTKDGSSLKKLFLKAPLSFARISSYFSHSRFHPILKIRRPHWGVDYVAPRGTPVSALGDGVVTFAGWKGQYGKLVEIRHPKGYRTRYGHLSRIRKGIRRGRRVQQGEVIGYVGATGLATGPHLHFEIRYHGRPINPLKLKVPRSPGLKKKELPTFRAHVDSILRRIADLQAAVEHGDRG